ncbi:Histidine kinase-, DNA gyrase B-, and HSP90-like ATPase [Granulicella pectinivorans]|uniref:histidine kinase n=1 Tax=Granulicella pectinivorans TaxID=474950 RepID=A0A1I6LWJ2_9BACT|nr:HAMP domain-containing sensor histidine kinase [Granulicella pectinivorans]SFS07819.1 Histidine kinase-, DNA gyrase B-, and HSP90-like ATPase [Granulicella pectinivorans]
MLGRLKVLSEWLASFRGPHGAGMLHGFCLSALGGMLAAVWALLRRQRQQARAARLERAQWEEQEAYARLDVALGPGGDTRPLARRVCRAVIEASRFRRIAMLVRDAEGKLFVAGSSGMDDLTVGALQTWGVSVIRQERGLGPAGPVKALAREKIGAGSFVMPIASPDAFESVGFVSTGPLAETDCRQVIVTMLRGAGGAVLGALVVGLAADRAEKDPIAMAPLESLAVKLARTIENASLAERLLRSEKLAGLGQLAGGVAHELNNPLTAVLGFAELILQSSEDARVREDADTIIREALRMKETVESLLNFWRPVTLLDEPVAIEALLDEVARACAGKLSERGVRLVVETGEAMPSVRGNRDRLRQILEHLLNNAAQAIAAGRERRRSGDGPRAGTPEMRGTSLPRGADEGDLSPTIRITVSHDGQTMHLIVSDTGPGFREPARAFDPFYTTRQPGEGAGLGLSICYGIVREHGGEISAFNLHPHGAAVVVELPVREMKSSGATASAPKATSLRKHEGVRIDRDPGPG